MHDSSLPMQAEAPTRRPATPDHPGTPVDRSMNILEYGIALLATAAAGVLALLR